MNEQSNNQIGGLGSKPASQSDVDIFNAVQRVLRTKSLELGSGNLTALGGSLLALSSVTKGFLPPRMTTAQRDAIVNPVGGLVIYNTTTAKLNVYTTAWEAVTSA